MRWRLFIEEYSPDRQYIKGENNVAADALICLSQTSTSYEDSRESFYALAECWMLWIQSNNADNYDFHPLSYEHLELAQEIHSLRKNYKIILMSIK